MTITGLVIDGGQSNDCGAGSYLINVPADHNRHGAAVSLFDINGSIVPATESLSFNIDPFVTANPDLGFGAQKVASNDYVDAYPAAQVLHVPCGYSGSSLESEWAVPSGPETSRMVSRINAAVALTGCRNAVLLWSQGENSFGNTWASLTQALWNYVQAQAGIVFKLILYCQLSATPPFGYTDAQAANWQAVRVAQTTLQTGTQIMIPVPDIGGYLHQNSVGQQTIGHAMGAILASRWVQGPFGVVYATKPLADAAVASVSAALGYPRCGRLAGTPIGRVAPCLCTGNGIGANVHASCPHATRQQTVSQQTNAGTWAMPVDYVMQASGPAKAAVPAITSPVLYTAA